MRGRDVEAPVTPIVDEAIALGPALRSFLMRRGHGDEATDLVQDLFVLLLSRPGRFVSAAPAPVRSLVFSIAWKLGANAARRRRRPVAGEAELEAARAPDLDPEARALLAERARRAAAALESLPEGTRRALLLVADEGLSAAEAARALGIGEEALRARLCRGRRRIAEILGGER